MATATKFFDFKPLDAKGQLFDFKQLDGRVVLIVNVASKCGFTQQYKGLEKVYKKYKDRGFVFYSLLRITNNKVIVAFPSNQFSTIAWLIWT